MKKQFNAVMDQHMQDPISLFNRNSWTAKIFLCLAIMVSAAAFTGCKKYTADNPGTNNELQTRNSNTIQTDRELVNIYNGLEPQTLWELQQARAATAKYQNISNALADGYEQGPVIQNMGYHFLKINLVSPVFDLRKPALLVYDKDDKSNFQLAAVEYAVPIDPQSPNTAPEGFTGNADEWDFNTLNTGWWTLHAWVWKNNPDGVFKMMNPLVIVQ